MHGRRIHRQEYPEIGMGVTDILLSINDVAKVEQGVQVFGQGRQIRFIYEKPASLLHCSEQKALPVMPFPLFILSITAQKFFQACVGGEVDIVEVRLFLTG